MSDLRTKGHQTILAAVLLLGCVSANATWIASRDLSGLGPNSGLSGYTLDAKHNVSAALLASPPVLFTDGRIQLQAQNERGIKPGGYEAPKFSRYLASNHLSSIENGQLAFRSWQTLFNSFTQRYVRDYSTRFVATIGEVMVRPAKSVPEPSAMVLMLLGLGATLVYRRKTLA